ncbi:MAG TPA: hypothetical protein VEG60_08465 [Candidatus Binatia bacterium]|nr:hypothetical protein [Candidatus Binatia bacterium]
MMSVEKIRRALPSHDDGGSTVGCRGIRISNRLLSRIPSLPGLLSLLLVVGCTTATITPTVRAPSGLPKPDRVLVHDFEVAKAGSDLNADLLPPVERGTTGKVRSEEEARVGKAAAQVLADVLVEQLRSRGIDAERASEAAPPGMNTLSIRGRFLWRHETEAAMRARIWFYQGSGVNSRLVAQADADVSSDLKRGAAPAGSSAYVKAQESDARRMGRELAERVAGYYRKQGWIQS